MVPRSKSLRGLAAQKMAALGKSCCWKLAWAFPGRTVLLLVLMLCHLCVVSKGNSIDADQPALDAPPQVVSSEESRLRQPKAKALPSLQLNQNRRQLFRVVAAVFHEDDDNEALVFKKLVLTTAGITKKLLRLLARGVRSSGDTFTNVVSGVIKAVGGVFNLLGDALSEVSLPLIRPRAPHDRMPHMFDKLGRRVGRWLRACSNFLFFVGESFILAGETSEVMTVGLGQSVEDSFRGLEIMTSAARKGLVHLLLPQRRIRNRSGELVWFSPDGASGIVSSKNNLSVSDSAHVRGMGNNEARDFGFGEMATAGTEDVNGDKGQKGQQPPSVPLERKAEEAGVEPGLEQPERALPLPTEPAPASGLAFKFGFGAGEYFVSHWQERFNQAASALSKISEGEQTAKLISEVIRAWAVEPFSLLTAAGLSPPTISIHVLGAMVFLVLVASQSWGPGSNMKRMLVLLTCILLVWHYIMAMDAVMRKKHHSWTAASAVGSFLREQMEELEVAKKAAAAIAIAGAGAGGVGKAGGIGSTRESSSSRSSAPGMAPPRFFETSVWVNVLYSALWILDGYPNNSPSRGPWQRGGLGPYISETWELILNDQLSLVPPGVANLQIKKFSLGTMAPVIKAVRFDATRDAICHTPFNAAAARSQKGVGAGAGAGGSGGWLFSDQWATYQQYFSGDYNAGGTANNTRNRSRQQLSASSSSAAACQHLIAEVDFSYLSRDMDIAFSLRNTDVQSMLPEATVKLSEISLSGTVRIDSELTSDYPFVGNATVSFLHLPVLDCTISTIGGVDLSSIPGMYTWINITMSWLLNQYTAPRYGTLDLRHNICPSCDGKLGPAPWSPDAIVEAAANVGNNIKNALGSGWNVLRDMRRGRAAAPSGMTTPLQHATTESSSISPATTASSSSSSSSTSESGPGLASLVSKVLFESQWSNGAMFCLSTVCLWLGFQLLFLRRKSTNHNNRSIEGT